MSEAVARPRTQRLLVPVVLGLLATGGAAFLALSRAWQRVTVTADGLPADRVTVKGVDAYPLASALALVVITGALAVLAAGPRVRRAVGAVVVLAAVGALVVVLDAGSLDSALRDAVQKSSAFTGSNAPDGTGRGPWFLVTLAAFALAAGIGLVTLTWGGSWPTMSGRYDAPGSRVRPSGAAHDPVDQWRSLDAGEDPTLGP